MISALGEIRLKSVPDESDIHSLISEALTEAGISFIHEARISPRKRVDFLCGTIAIEVKKSKPVRAQLIKQITGYLECECVTELIVVTQRHISIPDKLLGKPVHQLSLDRLWGIALP